MGWKFLHIILNFIFILYITYCWYMGQLQMHTSKVLKVWSLLGKETGLKYIYFIYITYILYIIYFIYDIYFIYEIYIIYVIYMIYMI